jgi:hypothetical protein
MNSFAAISEMSDTLRDVLVAGITASADPQLSGIPVHLLSPRDMRASQNSRTGISVWMYHVMRNAELQNRPPRSTPPNLIFRHELPLDLCYLITPIRDNTHDEQVLLGRIAQLFNDVPILRGNLLRGGLASGEQEFRLLLDVMTPNELAAIWHAMNEPYRASLTYVVQSVPITSTRAPFNGAPVMQRELSVHPIIEVQR